MHYFESKLNSLLFSSFAGSRLNRIFFDRARNAFLAAREHLLYLVCRACELLVDFCFEVPAAVQTTVSLSSQVAIETRE